MNRTLTKIKKVHDHTNTFFLPSNMFNELQHCTSISFGTRTESCNLKMHDQNENVIYISANLFETLQLPYEGMVNLIYHDNFIYLGPLIGIFTAGFTGSSLRPVGERSIFFSKILEVEQSVGTFSFIFGAHHINWEDGTINGYFYTKKGWVQKKVPFPNVVYDRLPNRKTENHETLKKIKERMKDEYLIPWFNPGFFNKWEIHQIFQNVKQTISFLPETIINPSNEELNQMLIQYQHVYLKPVNGSLGLGIYQILFSKEEDAFYCRYRNNDQNYLRKYPSLEALMKHLFKEKSLQSYIAQQGISLLRVDKKPIDFRVHTNKNEKGLWEMSALAIKVAGRGSVTTHVKSGGNIKVIEEIFQSSPERKMLINKIENAVISMSKVLDDNIDGLIGEIGFDIGIDKAFNIWLFEANSKPGRSIFKHPKLKESDMRSRQLPMSYAIYLTEKTIQTPEGLL